MEPTAQQPVRLALFWHMHQPSYRNLLSGEVEQPWTYLHAIKDYADMAYHLETLSGARATVNFVPILLDEIEHYAKVLEAHLQLGSPLHDPLLAWLAGERPLPSEEQPRRKLVEAALRAHPQQMIAPHPPYQQLAELARPVVEGQSSASYLSDTFLLDLLVWHHISWLGESIRQTSALSDRLYRKARHFTLADRRALLGLIQQTLAELIPRYRSLHQQGKVELTLSPYAHPITPLLLDYHCARETLEEAPLPAGHYPEGERRARWHFQHAIDRFQHHFGFVPQGLWPSEGAVSSATLQMAEQFGFRWCATGEGVWRNTLQQNHLHAEMPPGTPLRLRDSGLHCFARHDHLSDRIGFVYAPWHADDALHDLIEQILSTARSDHWQPDQLLAIIMDGENAWEHYPQNGWHFLRALYQRLAEHPEIKLTRFSEALQQGAAETAIEVEQITAGSWVYGTLSTWIGNPQKNRAWSLLAAATETLLPQLQDPACDPQLLSQLAICESSDWFWWLGEESPSEAAAEFDQLFRTHLQNLYRMAGQPVPEVLLHPIDERAVSHHGSAATMKASTL
jgi:alpha-amylase/alpha-mannosidase (GH57 family)